MFVSFLSFFKTYEPQKSRFTMKQLHYTINNTTIQASFSNMKATPYFQYLLILLFIFSLTSCNNEPLEGDFIIDDGEINEEASFTANINGEPFTAISTVAQLTDGVLTMTGTDAFGEVIIFNLTNLGLCTYDLSLVSNPASLLRAGEQNPFVTLGAFGGFGSLTVDEYSEDSLLVSGVFSFTGAREINNGDGTTVTQLVNVTNGVFTAIPIDLIAGEPTASDCSNTNGGDDGNTQTDEPNDFFALVDGVEFEETVFVAEEILIGEIPVIKITATNEALATIQFFVPRDTGLGTFDLESVLDGPVLLGLYNSGLGENNQTSNPGTITFTEFGVITGKIKAQCSFTAIDPVNGGTPVEITEGTFNIDVIENSTAVENVFNATIDDLDFVPNLIEVSQSPFGADATYVTILTRNETNNESLTISFPIPIEPGVYEMSPSVVLGNEVIGIYNPDIGNSILFRSNPGTLTIISLEISSGVVEGTFSFSAVDIQGNDPTTYNITNGSFVINLP